MNKTTLPHLIDLPSFHDERGSLSFGQTPDHIDFSIQRLYYLYDVPKGKTRGAHAHKALDQLMIPIAGKMTIITDDGQGHNKEWNLSSPHQALRLYSPIWRDVVNFSPDAVCLVLASDKYDPDDYIHDYDEFCRYVALL